MKFQSLPGCLAHCVQYNVGLFNLAVLWDERFLTAKYKQTFCGMLILWDVIGENACFSLLFANKEAGTFTHELIRILICLYLCNQREVNSSGKHVSLCSLWLIPFHNCQGIANCVLFCSFLFLLYVWFYGWLL